MLERALVLAPDHPVVLSNYGVLLSRLGRTDDAIAAFQKASDLEPLFLAPVTGLAHLLAETAATPRRSRSWSGR